MMPRIVTGLFMKIDRSQFFHWYPWERRAVMLPTASLQSSTAMWNLTWQRHSRLEPGGSRVNLGPLDGIGCSDGFILYSY